MCKQTRWWGRCGGTNVVGTGCVRGLDNSRRGQEGERFDRQIANYNESSATGRGHSEGHLDGLGGRAVRGGVRYLKGKGSNNTLLQFCSQLHFDLAAARPDRRFQKRCRSILGEQQTRRVGCSAAHAADDEPFVGAQERRCSGELDGNRVVGKARLHICLCDV